MAELKEGGQSADKAQELLRDAIESLTEGFALYDSDHRLVMFNQSYKKMNKVVADLLEPGLQYEMMLREMARRGGYSDAVGREDEWVAERLENAVLYAQDDEVNHTNGKSYQVSIHPTKLGGFVVTRTDITERKQAEAQERDGDLLVRTVLDASSAIVIMARIGDGEVLYHSPAAIELFGNTKFAREHYWDSNDRADLVTLLLADGQVDDYRVQINAKGISRSASLSSRFVEYRGEEVIVTSIVDLTEQIQAQALIQQVLEACPVPVQMTDAKSGKLLFRSPETTALFGSVDSSKSYYADPEDRVPYLEQLHRDGWVNDRKIEFVNIKGGKFWGAVSARLIEFQGAQVIVSNTRDMTEELALQSELAEQREMLFQNEKMSALGELLAGVAHELNNPLSIVVGHSLMLREEVQDEETLRRIEKISSAAERSAKIVKTFLAMARQQPAKMEKVDVLSIAKTAIDVAAYGQQGEALAIETDIPSNLPDIRADADQITQVILNILINALHAISQSGEGNLIKVSARKDKATKRICIDICDNGPGIAENIRARIFEPFFTTKEVGDGTGIGLAFCHRIIHSHGGQITLDKDFHPGSKFTIWLPIAQSEVADIEAEKESASTTQYRSALVVDDEPDVAELVAEILMKDGYQVDVSNSGAQALERLEAREYDIILSDLNMPDVDGRGLYEALAKSSPDNVSRIGFITGDTMGEKSQKLLRESGRPYLEKPVAPDELRQLVNKILNENEGAN